MKPRSHHHFPRTFVFCVFPLLACASVSADVIQFNEQLSVGGADPIPWTLPSGTNLLATATAEPATASTHEGSSSTWTTLTDSALGNPSGNGGSVTPNNNEVVTFALDLTSKPLGYDITSFDSYCAWGDSGRDNQQYTLEYSVVSAPATFISLGSFENNSGNPNNCTHINLTETSGYLALGVHSVRVTFGGGQENGYTGFREFVLRASVPPTPIITTLNEVNNTNIWTLPGGLNLLNGATAHTPSAPANTNHGNNEITSSSWATLTDASLGTYTNLGTSVGPLNNTSVIFPLDVSSNTKGYDITSFDAFGAWVNSGRDNLDFSVLYSTWDAPGVFVPLAHVVNHTANNGSPSDNNSTHTRIAAESGFMAAGVAAIKFNFDSQENGWVGYREFKALGSAASVTAPLTWTGATGGNWISGADSNWKQTVGGAASNYSSTGTLTFDDSGSNETINVPAALTAFSMAFNNTTPYLIGGSKITVTNGLTVSNSGNVTFSGPLETGAGVNYTGSGNLVFNGAIQAGSLTTSGSGIVTLAVNNTLSGITSVNSGTLTAASNGSLGTSSLSMTGGTASFTSLAPTVSKISGPNGDIILGNTAGGTDTNLIVGDASSVSNFSGFISNASGRVGSLTKVGNSSLTLSGENIYTGPTTVNGGSLDIDNYQALYNGDSASWTAANLVVGDGGTLGLDYPAFLDTELNSALSIGGFQPGSTLGIKTSDNLTLSRDLNRPGMGLRKTGVSTLTLSGDNTQATGLTSIFGGVLNASSPTTAIAGNVLLGNGGAPVYLNMGAPNQFGPNSVISVDNGTFYLMRMNLRGFDQALAGLNSPVDSAINIVQNDETNQPGYTVNPGPVTLTINAATDHSFRGIVRNGDGDALTVIKNGPGIQEFIHHPVQAFGYSGPTTINEGTLRLKTVNGNAGFASNITIGNGATLAFNAVGGDYNFNPEIHGSGNLMATGTNAIRLGNANNSFTGGLTIGSPAIESYDGFLALVSQGPQGAGNDVGQTCAGGAMTPTNVITVQGGATLALDGIAPLGESSVVPAYAPSVVINNSGLRGAGLAFVSNLTLNHAEVTVGNGMAVGGFDTSLCFVGTVVVGGDSSLATTIVTPTLGATANISLGSAGLPGTIFNVTDVTGTAAVDLDVDAALRNVGSAVSTLTKTGAGTMWLHKANTYTGNTSVVQGELRMDAASLADSADVSIAAGAALNLLHGTTDLINQLILDGVTVAAGTYGAVGNGSVDVQTALIKGDGILNVATGPGSEVTFAQWSAQITSGDSSRTGDPDNDGFTNLDEFLFGTSPIVSTGSLSTTEDNGSSLTIRWNERATGSSIYVLEESTTLENPWSVSSVVPTDNATQDIGDYVRKEAIIPIDSTRKFARVQATE